MKEMISFGHLQIADLGLHKNRGMELTYITRGRMEWVVDGRIEVVQQGDIFFTLPWQLHGSPVLQQPENEAWHLLFKIDADFKKPQSTFSFPKALGLSEEETRRLSRRFCQATRHAWPASSRLRELFPWMVEELESQKGLSRANARSLLRVILIELSRIMEGASAETASTPESERRIARFLEALKHRCGDEWSLESMARACGVHRTRFSNVVRKLTAFSPMTYLVRVRIDRARDLLRDPDRPVTEIAMTCGFSSSQYFSNVFRKCVGLSPSEYRVRFPDLYNLAVEPSKVFWRSIEEERKRVEKFKAEMKR